MKRHDENLAVCCSFISVTSCGLEKSTGMELMGKSEEHLQC